MKVEHLTIVMMINKAVENGTSTLDIQFSEQIFAQEL